MTLHECVLQWPRSGATLNVHLAPNTDIRTSPHMLGRSSFALVGLALWLSPLQADAQAPSSMDRVPPDLIEDIVTGSWVLADFGVLDAFGHISARHPTNPGHFLMSRALAPALVTSDDIMEFDQDGNAVDARGRGVFLERFIHAEIYKARPDVMSVVHTHSPNVIPFSVSKTPLRPLYHNAGFLAAGVPVWDIAREFGPTDMVVRDGGMGKSLARALSDKSVVLMRGHGDVAVGPAVKVAVFRAYYADVNARLQAQAIGLGTEVTYLGAEEGKNADAVNLAVVDRVWNLWKQQVRPTLK